MKLPRRPFVTLVFALLLLFGWRGVVGAEEPTAAQPGSLSGLVEAFEQTEQELADLRERRSTAATASERRHLKAKILLLEEKQQRLLSELEKVAGPLPPAVRDQPAIPLEEQVESQRTRNEAILDKGVERRLP